MLSTEQLHKYNEILWRLVWHKGFSYLRYIHLRNALSLVIDDITSVLSIGCGNAFAEMLLAIEHPDIEFRCTDIFNNYECSAGFAKKFGLKNINFEIHNILKPYHKRYDFVMSIEVLEHIEDFHLAAANMRSASNKYVFCLVPFSDEITNKNQAERYRAWTNHQHFCVGFNDTELNSIFPNPIKIRGVYWKDYGQVFYNKISSISADEVVSQIDEITQDALSDLLVDRVPIIYPEALGIWSLSRM